MSQNDSKILSMLARIGLTDKEAQLYLAALHLGPTTVLALSKRSGLKRTTIYDTIEKLMQRGLVSELYVGLKRKYVAESPRILETVLDEQRTRLQEHLPELINLHSFPATEQSVKVFEGIEGLKNGLNLMLEGLKSGDTYYVIANLEDILGLVEKFFYSFAKKRADHPIVLKTMLQDGPLTRKYVEWAKHTQEEIKIIKPEHNFMANIVVTPHRVVMPHIKPFTGAIAIENSQAVDTHQKLFEMLWDMYDGEMVT